MSDTRSQLEEVDALIAAAPDDPSLVQLRDDLLQLIALEEEEEESAVAEAAPPSGYDEVDQGQAQEQQEGHLHADSGNAAAASASEEQTSAAYTAQGTFMEHIVSKEAAVAEAPDLGSFHAVVRSSNGKSAAKSQPALKTGETTSTDTSAANLKDDSIDNSNTNNTTDITQQQSPSTTQPEKQKKKKKKKKSDDAAVLEAKFELPSHLVPLESDTSAQKLKKHRTAKALKSKFRAKQKEAEHAKKQNDWKSFATKGKKKRKGVVGGGSMFSTEEGVNARVGVISGGGGRKMTGFADPNKRHKFT